MGINAHGNIFIHIEIQVYNSLPLPFILLTLTQYRVCNVLSNAIKCNFFYNIFKNKK